ncbi:hypothetical protein BC628DRAFT_1341805 [Trametes gibbosa]|nr:hypothetical protein BC628DRAFT_1341805 [Trametes gibbosa]
MIDIFKDIIATTNTGANMFAAVWGTPYEDCPFWPVRAVERYQGPFNKKLSNKVLVVSNLALAKTLGESATLVVQEGFGHTSIGSPSNCLNEIMFAYMMNGTLPEGNDTRCAVDPAFEIFDGVNTETILRALAQ